MTLSSSPCHFLSLFLSFLLFLFSSHVTPFLSPLSQAQRHSNLELAQDVNKLLDPTNKPDPEVCAQDLIDFSPVYRCLHIHSVLVRGGV